jgi:hypothetical protein
MSPLPDLRALQKPVFCEEPDDVVHWYCTAEVPTNISVTAKAVKINFFMFFVFLVCLIIDLDPDFTGTIDLFTKLITANISASKKKQIKCNFFLKILGQAKKHLLKLKSLPTK